MADLENLLLEAAGRTKSRKSSGKDSDDCTRKNEASSQIPFKKRHGQTKSEEEEESDVGSDLYKDDDDRRRLAEMTELQRELILSDLASRRDEKILKEKLRRSNESTATIAPPPSRSSARNAHGASAMGSVLSKLRKNQLRQRSDPISTFDEKGPTNEAVVEEEDSDPDSGNGVSRGVGEPPSFEEVKGVTIRRSDLAKWLTEPFFEDLVAGCFVRIGIGTSKSGPVYRLCQVQSADDSSAPESEYEVEGKRTHKHLVCFWGIESSAARWKMAAVSDAPPTEEEFRQWAREAEPGAVTRQRTAEKAEILERARSHLRRPGRRPVNVAVEKDRLRRRLEAAEGRSDGNEVERVRGQLAELEASRRAREGDEKAARLSEMNRRNRVENLKTASGGPISGGARGGGGTYDPFSRRWTRSRNYYEKEEAKPAAVVGPILLAEVSDLVMGRNRKKESEVLSGIEILISEEILKSLGGQQGARVGYIARKQRIEATVGFRVLEDHGKRHAQTITLSEYKRRRGLL